MEEQRKMILCFSSFMVKKTLVEMPFRAEKKSEKSYFLQFYKVRLYDILINELLFSFRQLIFKSKVAFKLCKRENCTTYETCAILHRFHIL